MLNERIARRDEGRRDAVWGRVVRVKFVVVVREKERKEARRGEIMVRIEAWEVIVLMVGAWFPVVDRGSDAGDFSKGRNQSRARLGESL